MDLNKKILKAINEGIRKSLLSFDDIQFDQSTDANWKVSKSIKDWKFIQENFIDLGLPSGTLWCKWNIGASNGDTIESWYGNFYAWGEIKIKGRYTSKNYTYNENPEILPDEKDIVYLTNELMYMPSKELFEELLTLPNKWVTDYNGITGLNGRIFTGRNGNDLFIPAAGYYAGSKHKCDGSHCYLWSRSLYTDLSSFAWYLYFNSDNINIHDNFRFIGQSVRGVVNKL